ncbi:MAG TPA: hypothetical protein VN517_03770 [Terriglobales bacterium]|nr:hypothetical protein [Terriglobales bacterium]
MSEEKVEQPKVGELPPLDADIEERISRIDELDSIEKTNLAEEVLDNRERQLLAEQQVSAAPEKVWERCQKIVLEAFAEMAPDPAAQRIRAIKLAPYTPPSTKEAVDDK